MTTPRIQKETQRLLAEPVDNVTVQPGVKGNPRHFYCTLAGPKSTPYEGGVFQIELFLPADYPLVPLKARFMTRVYHPNIDILGRICLDILKDKWSPALQIRTVLQSISALLDNPVVDDPLDARVGEHFKNDLPGALAKAKEWTLAYATKKA